jgi:hypothetical protein
MVITAAMSNPTNKTWESRRELSVFMRHIYTLELIGHDTYYRVLYRIYVEATRGTP